MPSYRYIARSRAGQKVEGTIEAPDRRGALSKIERMDCVPVSVVESAAAAPAPAKTRGGARFRLSFRRDDVPRFSTRELLTFTRELSDLLASGRTRGDALHTLSHRGAASGPAVRLTTELRDEIVQGKSLSEALGARSHTFPPLYVSMVRAGEAAGSLSETLQRLAEHFERMQDARERVMTALAYPTIVLIIGFLTMIFIMVYVIPRFAKMFAELGSTLPLPTRMLIGLSEWLTGIRGLVLLGLTIAVVIMLRRWLQSEAGRNWWHRAQLRLPVAKLIISSNAYAHFARTLGSLLGNGVPVLTALSIVEQTIGNRVIAGEIHEARDRVTDGSSISGPLAAGKIFPTMLTDMLAVGERTGDMVGALGHIARRYENERDRHVKLFITILEPLLIVTVAVVVGFVAISMLLAVFDLTSGLNV